MKPKIKELILNRDHIFRILVFLFSTILFSTYPLIVFIVYMYSYQFFSYDFFINGIFGMNVFFSFLLLFFIIFMFILGFIWFFLPGILLEIISSLKSKKINFRLEYIFFVGVALIYLFAYYNIFIQLENKIDKDFFIFLLMISISFPIHYGILFSSKIKKFYSLISLFIVYGFSVYIIFIYNKQVGTIVSYVLSKFNMGGLQKIVLYDIQKNQKISKGYLIFISPKNIYFRSEKNNDLNIIERNSVLIKIQKEKE